MYFNIEIHILDWYTVECEVRVLVFINYWDLIASGGNVTRDSIKRANADARLRPRGHRGRQEGVQLCYINEDNSK